MGIYSRIRSIFGSKPNITTAQAPITIPVASALDKIRKEPLYQYSMGGSVASAASGASVTPASALTLSGVFACVRNLAEDYAGLPICVLKKLGRTKQEQVNHPIYKLLHDGPPNPEMTAFSFRSAMMVSVLLYGKACAEIERDGLGRPIALWPLQPWEVEILRDPKGVLYFRYRGVDLAAADVLYIPGAMSTDGILSTATTRIGRDVIGLGLAMQGFCSAWFANGAQAGAVVKIPPQMSASAADNFKTTWARDHQGYDNANKITLLEQGMEYEAEGGDKTEQKQLVDQRVFQLQDLARLWRMPPHLIFEMSRATWSNSEQGSLDYVKFGLRSHCIRWEEALKWKMAPEQGVYIKHNMDALLRGDLKSRADAYSVLVQAHIYMPNECRELEDLDPYEGGDEPLVTNNTGPAKPNTEQPGSPATPPYQGHLQSAFIPLLNEAFKRYSRLAEDKLKRGKDPAEHFIQIVVPVLEAAKQTGLQCKSLEWLRQQDFTSEKLAEQVFNG